MDPKPGIADQRLGRSSAAVAAAMASAGPGKEAAGIEILALGGLMLEPITLWS